ncbi:hypothetical protein EYC80_004411 [Monilinia laxa]|uniref:Uncharacterized protein n=1 Tax=Monilinia laxa TaxID=61186 RepID=A0A5N6KMX9_MONLA|nr:hypothetical protein EYC80_004411 [Monilinia laxa]
MRMHFIDTSQLLNQQPPQPQTTLINITLTPTKANLPSNNPPSRVLSHTTSTTRIHISKIVAWADVENFFNSCENAFGYSDDGLKAREDRGYWVMVFWWFGVPLRAALYSAGLHVLTSTSAYLALSYRMMVADKGNNMKIGENFMVDASRYIEKDGILLAALARTLDQTSDRQKK